MLDESDLLQIFRISYEHYVMSSSKEVTLESLTNFAYDISTQPLSDQTQKQAHDLEASIRYAHTETYDCMNAGQSVSACHCVKTEINQRLSELEQSYTWSADELDESDRQELNRLLLYLSRIV